MPPATDRDPRASAASWRRLIALVREPGLPLPPEQVRELAVDTLGVLTVLGTVGLALAVLFVPAASWPRLAASAVLLILLVALRRRAARRYSPAIPWLGLLLAVATCAAWVVVLGTVQAVQALVLLLPVIFSTFLFGVRAGLGVVAACAATMFALAYAQSRGWLWEREPITPWNQAWVFTQFALAICLVLVVLRNHLARWHHAAQEQRLARERDAQLRQLHDRLAVVIQAGHFGVWEYDADERCFHYDAQQARIYGLGETAGRKTLEEWQEMIHPEDLARLRATLRQALAESGRHESEVRILQPGQPVRRVRSVCYVQRTQDGRTARLVGLDRDVTPEVEARRAQEDALRRRDLAVRAVGGSVWEYDGRTGTVVPDADLASPAGWGYEPQAHRLEDVVPLVVPEQQDDFRRFIARMVRSEEYTLEGVFAIRHPGVGLRQLRTVVQVERDPDGRALRAVGMNIDVTAEMEARLALQRTNERLTVALSAVRASVWELDPHTGRLRWDERGPELYGLDTDLDPGAWERLLVPEDREATLRRWKACLEDVEQGPYALEYRIQRPDGASFARGATNGTRRGGCCAPSAWTSTSPNSARWPSVRRNWPSG